MKKQDKSVSDPYNIRQEAEEVLKKRPMEFNPTVSESEALKLLHELQVYQIELELQNDELKVAKEAAEVASLKYTELYDFAPSGYFTLSKEGKIGDLNFSGAQMLGKERRKLKNSFFESFISEDTRPVFNHFLQELFNSNTRETCEVILSPLECPKIHVYLTGIITEGEIQCFVTAIDISERKYAEQALRASEERNHAIILHTSMDGFWLFDKYGYLLEVNETYCRMSGYTLEELQCLRITDLESEETVEHIDNHLKQAFLQGENRFETRHRRKDGSIFDVEVSMQSQPVNEGQYVAFLHDITERKHKEKELFESNEQFRMLFENSSDAIFFTKPDGSIFLVNPGAERMFERSKEEILSLGRYDISNENDPRLIPALEERRKTGSLKGELTYLRKDGTIFPVDITSNLYTDSYGIVRASIVARDITERKKAEAGLRHSEERYRTLFNSMIEGFSLIEMVFDENNIPIDYLFLETNSAYEEQSGLKDVVGKTMRTIAPEMEQYWFDLYGKIALTGQLMRFENEAKVLNKWFEVCAFRMGGEGSLKVAVCLSDITKRKKAEIAQLESSELNRLLFENSGEGIMLTQPDGSVYSANPEACKMFGRSEDEIIKLARGELSDLNDPRLQGLLDERRRTGRFKGEFNYLRKDGTPFPVELSSILFKDSLGIERTSTFFRDITERKRAEESIRIHILRLNLAMQAGNMAWWEMDILTGNVIFEKSKTEMLGYAPEEFTNYRDFMALIHPEDQENCLNAMRNHYLGLTDKYESEYRILNKSGEYIWCSDIGSITNRDANGKPVKVTGLAFNINGRKQSEEEILTNNARLTLAMEVSDMAWWEMNIVTGAISFDKRKAEMLGYDPKNFKHYNDFMKLVHPEDAERAMEAMRRHIYGSADKYEVEYRILAKSGEYKWFYDIGSITERDARGKAILATGLVTNITARKKSEQKIKEGEERRLGILQTAMDGYWLLDMQGHLLEVNETYCRMSGYNKEELLSRNITDLENPETVIDIETRMQHIAEQKESRFETYHRRKDGSIFEIEASVQYQAVEGGQLVVFMHDITERKQSENALRESDERVRFKLRSILSPEGNIAELELNDIIDVPTLQKLMENFYELVQIPIAIIDIKGKVLVGVGWQDLCTKFHRVHPQSCQNCIESDVHLTEGIPDGEFKLYKCKNNMWDMATPLIIGGEHKGNLFLGQFFFESEPINYQLFREQAEQYGFDEQQYLHALEKAPRLNSQKLEHAKSFFLNLSRSISQLSYSNIKLAKSITQQKQAEEELHEYIWSQQILSMAATQLLSTMSRQELIQFAVEKIQSLSGKSMVILNEYNPATEEIIIRGAYGSKNNIALIETIIDRSLIGMSFKVSQELWKPMDERNLISVEGGIYDLTFRQLPKNLCNQIEKELHITESFIMPLAIEDELLGTLVILVENDGGLQNKLLLDNFIKQITLALKNNYVEDALRESEFFFRESQQAAFIGSFKADFKNGLWESSDVLEQIYGIGKGSIKNMEGWLNLAHPDDREMLDHHLSEEVIDKGIPFYKEFRIIRNDNGLTRWIQGIGRVGFDENNKIDSIFGTLQDITERKLKEKALHKLNHTLAALGKSSQAMAQAVDETEYLKLVCEIVIEDTEFAMVWVGFAQDDEAKSIRTMASAGFKDDYLQTIDLSWGDNENGRGPTGTAIRTGNMSMCNNMLTVPDFEPWREQAMKLDYASWICFPLKTGDYTFGAFTIYSKEPDSFLEDEINLLNQLSNDLAYGITTIRLRAAHKLAEIALNQSHNELEVLVIKRTQELQITNDLLKKEINNVKLKKQSLKLAEEKYRTVADYTHGWEFWLDKDDHFLYCSPSCERITGHKAAEFIQNSDLLFDIIHPDDLINFRTHRITEHLSQEVNHELEYRIIHMDGSIRWIGHECQPITDEAGQFKGVRGSNKDITGRKVIEQLLKINNQKYRLLSENITDGIFICKSGRLEYVNKAMNLIFGYPDYKMDGLMLTQLAMPEYHKELKDILSIKSAVNKLQTIEIECSKKDHSKIHVEIIFNFITKEDVIYGVVHDITDKKLLQKNIVKAIIQTEEKERAYFSKELHDGLGPLLSTIKLYLQWSERPKTNTSREEIIHKAEDILEEALTAVKEISNKLSPHLLNYYGLTSAIQSFVDKLDETSATQIVFESNSNRRIGNEIEAALYRVIIECINNSIKYAGARTININLNDTGSHLNLQYKDDGKGFDLEYILSIKKGLGLFNLQSRIQTIGGKINLFSEPGKGVDYQFSVDL